MADLHINNEKQYFWSPEEDAVIQDIYAQGGYDAVKQLLPNRSKSAIQQRALKLGVKYLVYNSSYFDKIDTHEKAYWLGFLYADGYVTSGDRWGLELTASDKGHMQNLLNAFDCNIQIKERTRKSRFDKSDQAQEYKSCTFLIKNKHMHDSLVDKGVIQNKTNILKFPSDSILDGNFYADFIRGFFDGDGCVTYSDRPYIRKERKGKEYVALRKTVNFVCASEQFIYALKDILEQNGIHFNLYLTKRDTLFVLQTRSGSEIRKFYHYLYDNTLPVNRLERKYLKMKDLVQRIGGGQNVA